MYYTISALENKGFSAIQPPQNYTKIRRANYRGDYGADEIQSAAKCAAEARFCYTVILLPLLLAAAHYGLVLAAVYGANGYAAAAASTRQRGRRALRALLR